MTAPTNYPLVVNSVLQAAQNIQGGTYVFTAVATTWNSNTVTVSLLGPNGSTQIPLSTTFSANAISAAISLPAGTLVATQSGSSTGLYLSAEVVPVTIC